MSQLERIRAAALASEDLLDHEVEPSDQELLDQHPAPEHIDEAYDPVLPVVRLVEQSVAPEVPRVYGPVRILRRVDTKTNSLGKEQASVQAILEGKKPIRILVSAFGKNAPFIEGLEEGCVYDLRGYMRRKIGRFNDEKVVSYYLNLA